MDSDNGHEPDESIRGSQESSLSSYGDTNKKRTPKKPRKAFRAVGKYKLSFSSHLSMLVICIFLTNIFIPIQRYEPSKCPGPDSVRSTTIWCEENLRLPFRYKMHRSEIATDR